MIVWCIFSCLHTFLNFCFQLFKAHGQPYSTFEVPSRVNLALWTLDRTSRCNKIDAVRLYASYRLNLLLLKGQRCVSYMCLQFPIILDKFSLQDNLNILYYKTTNPNQPEMVTKC